MNDNPEESRQETLRHKTARTLKWNTIDRLASQVLYGVVGIVLANVVPKEDFGLVGILLAFQAFAIVFADSGFGAALLQRKDPTERDYSTVFWFNLVASLLIYVILWIGSPVIASLFHDQRLESLSKVMFLTFVLNSLAIVQTNRLMKRMEVRMLAVSNIIAQVTGGGLGIVLALRGWGAWALVWQSVTLAGVRTLVLWVTGRWMPLFGIWKDSFAKIWRIGLSVLSSSMLNTFFLTVYSFVIGYFYSIVDLGVYSQSDKWSKMGIASLSQLLTATFVPLLSRFQDSGDDFRRYVSRVNRFTGFILFPAMIGLAAIGTPLFHTLFGNKWDSSILLFQILCLRGIFVVLVSFYGNCLLAKGYGKKIFMIEVVKDASIAIALLLTVFSGSLKLLVWGQFMASLATWIIIVVMTSRSLGIRLRRLVGELLPFAVASIVMWGICWMVTMLSLPAIVVLSVSVVSGILTYAGLCLIFRLPELGDALSYLRRRGK